MWTRFVSIAAAAGAVVSCGSGNGGRANDGAVGGDGQPAIDARIADAPIDSPPDAGIAVDVTFTAGAIGFVEISQNGQLPAHYCDQSCTFSADPTEPVTLVASSPSELLGLSGCPSGNGSNVCTVPAGSAASISPILDTRPTETDRVFGAPILSVDADGSGWVIGTGSDVELLDASLNTVWSAAGSGIARVASDGSIYVQTPSQLEKLDAGGHSLWTIANTDPMAGQNLGHHFVALANGGVAIAISSSGFAEEFLDAIGFDGTEPTGGFADAISTPTVNSVVACVPGASGGFDVGAFPSTSDDPGFHGLDLEGPAVIERPSFADPIDQRVIGWQIRDAAIGANGSVVVGGFDNGEQSLGALLFLGF